MLEQMYGSDFVTTKKRSLSEIYEVRRLRALCWKDRDLQVIGWFAARGGSSARPSLREKAITAKLAMCKAPGIQAQPIFAGARFTCCFFL